MNIKDPQLKSKLKKNYNRFLNYLIASHKEFKLGIRNVLFHIVLDPLTEGKLPGNIQRYHRTTLDSNLIYLSRTGLSKERMKDKLSKEIAFLRDSSTLTTIRKTRIYQKQISLRRLAIIKIKPSIPYSRKESSSNTSKAFDSIEQQNEFIKQYSHCVEEEYISESAKCLILCLRAYHDKCTGKLLSRKEYQSWTNEIFDLFPEIPRTKTLANNTVSKYALDIQHEVENYSRFFSTSLKTKSDTHQTISD